MKRRAGDILLTSGGPISLPNRCKSTSLSKKKASCTTRHASDNVGSNDNSLDVMKRHRISRPNAPDGSITLATYAALEGYVQAFAAGHMNLLILNGSGGLGKSRSVRRVLGDKASWIEGNATAFGMFMELHRSRDRFVVIDDVDSLYSDKNAIRLLKCLCQTEVEKSVGWHSATRSLEKAGIPREFVTRSRVIIICNDWRTLNRNVAALQDRGHMLLFRPTAAEVHAQAEAWFDDKEILAWFSANLHRISEPSFRLYLRAAELRRAGMDWTNCLPLTADNRRRRLVMELRADKSHATEQSRVQSFVAQGGGCRATYFNYVRRISQ